MTKEACLKQDSLGLSEQRSKIKWFRKEWYKSLRKKIVFPINWLKRHKMHISYRNHQKLAAIVIRHRLWLYVINTFNLWPCTIYCHPRWALTTSVKAVFHGQSSVCRTFIQTENRSIQSSRHIYFMSRIECYCLRPVDISNVNFASASIAIDGTANVWARYLKK